MARKGLFLGLAWGLLGLTAAFLWLAAGSHVAAGSAIAAEWTVCPAGPPDCQFDSVQAAVDAAGAGDTIKVAAGTYTDVHTRPVPAGYETAPASGVLTQVVYITRSVTVRGGYTVTNSFADPPNPISYPTTLNAGGLGRVVLISGHVTSTLEGLRLVAGNATGLGGRAGTYRDAGGGLYAAGASLSINDCALISNTAATSGNGQGGGLFALDATLTMTGCAFRDNRAAVDGDGLGGGLSVAGTVVRMAGCTLRGNVGAVEGGSGGGAVYAAGSEFAMEGCTVVSNTASTGVALPVFGGDGGGLYLKNSTVLLTGTVLSENVGVRGFQEYGQISGNGGGAYIRDSDVTIQSCTVVSNVTAASRSPSVSVIPDGAGLYLTNSQGEISGTLVAGNVAQKGGYCNDEIYGGGVFLDGGDMMLRNNTIRRNVVKTSPSPQQESGHGGGVAIAGGSATLLSNTIEGNVASMVSRGEGGGVFGWGAITLHDNLIQDNFANWDAGSYASAGGGIYLGYGDAVTVTNNVIRGNRANAHGAFSDWADGMGGGVWVRLDALYLADNLVEDNAASVEGRGLGGGLFASADHSVVTGNVVRGNRAGRIDSEGGGLLVEYSLSVTNNVFVSNTAATLDEGKGGGIFVNQAGSIVLRDNLVMNNVASRQGDGQGGGVATRWEARATLSGNLVLSNAATLSPTAEGLGGGLFADYEASVTLENDVLAGNRAGTEGSGLWLGRTSIYHPSATGRLRHVTLADNQGGAAVYVGPASEVALTDTILAGHSQGITVAGGATAALEATLWHGNGQDWAGAGVITTGTVNVWGDPDFVDPAAWDYHLGPGSVAIDAGIAAGVLSDLDGQARPAIGGYDIGADEFYGPRLALAKTAAPDPVLSGGVLTYTLRLTNSGTVALAATVTDHLPAEVVPAGVLTWTLPPLPAGQAWSRTVVVTVAAGYLGTLTNRLAAGSLEGAAGAYTHTVTVVEGPIAGLAAWNDGPAILGDTTLLTAAVAAGSNVTYTWALGDGALAGGPLVSHVYPATGTYTALVTAANSLGWMTATTVVQVEVPPWHVYLPLVVRSSP